MKFALLSLLLALTLISEPSRSDVSLNERAHQQFAAMIHSEAGEDIEAWFADSGLAEADIERLVDQAVAGISACVVQAMSARPDPEIKRFLMLVADGASEAEMRKELGADYRKVEAVLDPGQPDFETCLLNVQQELGLVGTIFR